MLHIWLSELQAILLLLHGNQFPSHLVMLTVFMEIQVKWMPNLEIILDSHDAGICLVSNNSMNEFYNFNHFEYDTDTLKKEYIRDINNGLYPNLPENYFPNNDTKNEPVNNWAENAVTFFNYWLLHITS